MREYRPDWPGIRQFYRHHEMSIHRAGSTEWGIDPYAWESEAGIRLTPIEDWLWQDIRTLGLVMYPQYPVGSRFVDFGNPGAKVALECDGAAYHRDAHVDAQRQREIEAHGWTVYRFPGWLCRTDTKDGPPPVVGPAYAELRRIANAHPIRLWTKRQRAA